MTRPISALKLPGRVHLAVVADWPTVDGGRLRQGPGAVDFHYRLGRLAAPDGLGADDGVACHIELTDPAGGHWSAAAHIAGRYFPDTLALAQWDSALDCQILTDAPSPIQSLFAAPSLLDGVRVAADDGFYRAFILRGEVVQARFKHARLVFDVAADTVGDEWPRLYARLRAGVCHDPARPLEQIRQVDELPALVFALPPVQSMLLHGAMFDATAGWIHMPLPQPLVFEKTG